MSMVSFLDKVAGAKAPTQQKQDEPKVAEVHVPAAVAKQTLPLTKTVVAVVVIGASFYAGLAYQKAQQASSTSTLSTNGSSSQNQNGNTNGGFGSGSGGGFGSGGGYGRFGGASMSTSQVTTISSSSITTEDSSGNSATHSITGNTLISDSGQLVSTSDIKTGDSVIVIPSRDNTSVARRIIVNPDFGQNQSQSNNQPVTVDPNETQLN